MICELSTCKLYAISNQIIPNSYFQSFKFMAEVNDVKSNLDAANRQMQAVSYLFLGICLFIEPLTLK